MAREMEPRVPNLRVCKRFCCLGGTAEEEGRSYGLPWYRLIGVVKSSSATHGGRAGLLVEQVSGHHVVRG